MGRKKIAIASIENERQKVVTFGRRRAGLIKKAHELAVLCDSRVMVLIYDKNDQCHMYSSDNGDEMITKYMSRDFGKDTVKRQRLGDYYEALAGQEPPVHEYVVDQTGNGSDTLVVKAAGMSGKKTDFDSQSVSISQGILSVEQHQQLLMIQQQFQTQPGQFAQMPYSALPMGFGESMYSYDFGADTPSVMSPHEEPAMLDSTGAFDVDPSLWITNNQRADQIMFHSPIIGSYGGAMPGVSMMQEQQAPSSSPYNSPQQQQLQIKKQSHHGQPNQGSMASIRDNGNNLAIPRSQLADPMAKCPVMPSNGNNSNNGIIQGDVNAFWPLSRTA